MICHLMLVLFYNRKLDKMDKKKKKTHKKKHQQQSDSEGDDNPRQGM